ncbi:hypothetical protein SPBR_02488 [Sporothrix brasiliensis 5110]|uniref:Uncharacterized protein n=1 Tax=Sporothrix brasiliensis 5110 TaxID=1398154 RepID=A0A0C2J2B4_9PEZI|nr:uncharacterized protein SPBR_02488 [Sporothrix brasiliensis 5110]KIH93170.1 hypothetical protein SPBR_02488 [Sporothrix brasiliensis 5110]
MAFQFVNYDGPSLPEDKGVRTMIRRQAMHDVAIDRRTRGNYGKANQRQVPVFVDEGWASPSGKLKDIAEITPTHKPKPRPKANPTAKRPPRTRPSAQSAQSGQSGQHNMAFPVFCYSAASSSRPPYGVPTSISFPDSAATEKFTLLLNLVPLTGLRLGIGKLSSFQLDLARAGPTRRAQSSPALPPLDLGNPKLAHYITSRHGHVPALRFATDAVLAQLRLVALRAHGTPSTALARDATLVLYQKALRAVQLALADERQRLTEETLCATQLLAVFELLDENVPSWMHHAGGAAQLIRLRGAHRFRASEPGTALFMAHIGTIVMDAFLGNKACFLAEDAWMALLRSAILDDPALTPVQDLSLAMWSHIVTGPAKFKTVTDLVMAAPALRAPDPRARDAIIAHLLADRASLVGWMDRAMRHPAICDDDFEADDVYGIVFTRLTTGTRGSTGERRNADDKRAHCRLDRVTQLSLWGTNIVCRILKSRLLVAMAPARFRALETECQYLAARVMQLDAGAAAAAANKSSGVGSGLGDVLKTSFVSQNTWIVRGVLETKDIWGQDGDVRGDGNGGGKGDGAEDKMIEKWKFEAWCRAIGRTLPRRAAFGVAGGDQEALSILGSLK